MKTQYLFYFLIGLLAYSCGDDVNPEIAEDKIILNYDSENDNAPSLNGGLFEFGVRFTSLLARNVKDKNLEQVSFYLYDAPDQMFINISRDFTATAPGNIEYTQEIINPRTNSWNTITLNQPFPLDGEPFWVGIEVTHRDQMQTVGCDAGPARANADWLYDEADKNWEAYSSRTEVSVNWNIRAVISE